MVIDSILASIGGGIAIYLLQSEASKCNAKMDTVSHHYDESIFKFQIRQWFDPIQSWTNKQPEHVETWRKLAATRLPKFLYLVINKVKPGYDPFSDFWHYQKFLFLLLELCVCIVWSAAIWVSRLFHGPSFWLWVACMAICAAAWVAGWLMNFNDHLRKLRE